MPDHAKKGRPKKPNQGKKSGTKKAAQAQPSPRPRLFVMLAAVLIISAAFGYFLIKIDGSAETVAIEPAPVVTAKPKPAPKQSQEPLPQAPSGGWQYEKLDQKEVAVELPEQQESTRPYRLQCASVRSRAQAEELKARIAFQGHESFIKAVQGSKDVWYQVYLGPFDRKRQAETVRHKMQRADINHCKIFFWQG
ncbi:SPOR domain-containing protein [Psychrobium sp. 1_MG-2023]|uniref:SPOR domain-containing protein n=1 Tax=Psychrobium sp. 1_MG-2023 TaxID=3062624 RepID=UPI000C337E7D|nr:SPOR domain-containing protein [Psychrobium sp. 1_MG-2023]MDP2562516.1 SPOR domain-containing protein [Psychrobium sp. 1_MG-2023]PKF57992.1 hypothetical protein CW748_05595 [Alteromonadales bacterium alter-6D02]